MNIEVTDKQVEAIRLIGFWWGCFDASQELLDEPPIPDDSIVLHYCGNGTTAMVMAEHLRAIRSIDTNPQPGDSLL